MTQRDPQLLLQAAPFLRRGVTTRGLMVEVMLGLAPVVIAAAYFFGVGALLIIAATTLGAVLTEWLVGPARLRGATLLDGSADLEAGSELDPLRQALLATVHDLVETTDVF